MNREKVRSAALRAKAILETMLTEEPFNRDSLKIGAELQTILDNSKRERTQRDKARDKRRTRKPVDMTEMQAKLAKIKEKRETGDRGSFKELADEIVNPTRKDTE